MSEPHHEPPDSGPENGCGILNADTTRPIVVTQNSKSPEVRTVDESSAIWHRYVALRPSINRELHRLSYHMLLLVDNVVTIVVVFAAGQDETIWIPSGGFRVIVARGNFSFCSPVKREKEKDPSLEEGKISAVGEESKFDNTAVRKETAALETERDADREVTALDVSVDEVLLESELSPDEETRLLGTAANGEYQHVVYPGASIGTTSLNKAGSLGYYLTNEGGRLFALTVAHNFALGDPACEPGSSDDLPKSVGAGSIIEQPARIDFNHARRKARNNLRYDQLAFNEARNATSPPAKKKRLEVLKQHVISSKAMVKNLRSSANNLEFGKITNIYELAQVQDRVYDYCLVEVGKTRRGKNLVAKDEIRVVEGVSTGEHRKNREVTKMGRTSGKTMGSLYHTLVTIKDRPRFPGKSLEFRAVLGKKDIGTAAFAQRGDSGGPVAIGRSAIGLVQGFGDVETGELKGYNVTVIQVLEDILARIKEKFGEVYELADEI